MNTQTQRNRPFPGSVTARVWEIADDLLQRNATLPSGRQVADAYLAEDPNRNEGTAFTQYSHWKKAHLAHSSPVQSATTAQSGEIHASADGSLTIPAQFVRHLNLGPERTVYLRANGNELHLASPMTELRRLQDMLRGYNRPGLPLLSDELIADRRAEAARELNPPIVLDSSAVIAVLLSEPGGSIVSPHLQTAAISSANLIEIITKLLDRRHAPEETQATTDFLSRRMHPLSVAQSIAAGHLRETTRHLGLSLGDRCCLALALELGATVLTTDRAWASLNLGLTIEVIR